MDDLDELDVLAWRSAEFRGPFPLTRQKAKDPHAWVLLFRDPAMKFPSINLGNFPDEITAARANDAALVAIGKKSYNFPGEIPDAALVERFKARLIPLMKPIAAP